MIHNAIDIKGETRSQNGAEQNNVRLVYQRCMLISYVWCVSVCAPCLDNQMVLYAGGSEAHYTSQTQIISVASQPSKGC